MEEEKTEQTKSGWILVTNVYGEPESVREDRYEEWKAQQKQIEKEVPLEEMLRRLNDPKVVREAGKKTVKEFYANLRARGLDLQSK